jgi:GNAT superfamily N-acetyltransferase
VVAGWLAAGRAGTVTVFERAQRCCELVDRHPAWRKSETMTAMVCPDLSRVPMPGLPPPLSPRRVRRQPGARPDGVPLGVVAEAAMRADPRIVGPAAALESYLRRLPWTVQLFAAVDQDGAVRATAGCDVTAAAAGVFFVNTDPEWRSRGIAQAMTALALDAARTCGAEHASLDATGAGLRIYDRLGFAAVARATRFTGASRHADLG